MTTNEKKILEESFYQFIKGKLNEKEEKSGEQDDKALNAKLKSVLPALQDTYDDDKTSYNLTRSQIAYEMYPNLDDDTARSKLSQKLNGKKGFKPNELNKLANIVSGDIA
jgi:hypothetical protein